MEAKEYVLETLADNETQVRSCTVVIGKGLAEKVLRMARFIRENELLKVSQFIYATWQSDSADRVDTDVDQMVVYEHHFVINAITKNKVGVSTVAFKIEKLAQDFGLTVKPDHVLKDDDYELGDGAVWLGTQKFSVRVRENDDMSVMADIYPRGQEDGPPLSSACASAQEIEEAEGQNIAATVETTMLQWLILPDEQQTRYTNWGNRRPGDASELIARVNADPALNQGHSDWRLPTIDELQTLMGTPDAPDRGWYWSSSPYVGNSLNAWVVSFDNGSVSDDDRNNYGGHVRLVRASQ